MENYEKKYKKALENLQEALAPGEDGCKISGLTRDCLENIFPELAESENERIRKGLIKAVSRIIEGHKLFDTDVTREEALTWLEKQDNKKQVEHLELKAGHWYICHRPYCCRADNLTVKEGEKFQCEKDGVVKGFVIKEPEKYFMEISTPDSIEDDLNDEVRRISTIQVLEYAKSLDVYNQYGKEDIDKNIAWLEKQDEKVKEAVYEWNNEKKELNKIESKTLDANKVIEWLKPYSVIVDNIIDEFKKDFRL